MEAAADIQTTRLGAPSGTVTFLFTDIEGSTRLLERLREAYAVLLDEQRHILRAAFARWNGAEIDTQGDAFFTVFPRAIDAVCCVMEAQRELATHTWPQGAVVRVRMGLHTGEPIQVHSGYVGMDVHRAARIAAAGHGGQVLLSQTTRDLVYQDLPKGTALRDLGEHKLKDIRYPQPIYQLEVEGLEAAFPPLKSLSAEEEPPTPGEPPYKGLQYFDEADAEWYFGREQASQQLAQAVQGQRFLAVIGASGSGKSSMVRAGLVPALKRSQPGRWQVHIFTPTSHPLESLAVSLTRQAPSVSETGTLIDDLRRDPRSLHLYVRRGIPQGSQVEVLLVIDQFEELFTQCRDEAERQAFVDNLLYATEAEDSPLRVVIALRADFYQHLAQYAGLRGEVAKHQEYLGAMEASELRQAIEAPAQRGGREFSPGLVDLILHDIGASAGRQPEPGALPLLSHALLETWKRRRGNLMNLRAYSEAGGVRGAIARTAESVYYGQLTQEQQPIARNIFLRLTELGEGTQDTRRRVAISELVPPAPHGDLKQVEEVLVKLADARLITTGEGTAEVAHEALIREWPTLREWLSEDREGLRVHRHLTEAAQEWELLERDPGALYRGARLAQAVEWAEANSPQLNAQEKAFLDASQEAVQREAAEREAQRQRELQAAQKLAEAERQHAAAEKQRAEEQAYAATRLRQRALYLTMAVILAGVLAVAAFLLAQEAGRNSQIAQANAKSAQSAQAQAEAKSTQAIALQATAEAEANTRATAEAVAIQERDLSTSRELAVMAINNLETDPERSILLALYALRTAYTHEAENALHLAIQSSRVRMALTGHMGGVRSVEFSPDGKTIATASFGDENMLLDEVTLWEAGNGQKLFNLSGRIARYSPDGRRLATGDEDGTVAIWDLATRKILLTLRGHSKPIEDVHFSPDGKLLVSSSFDDTFIVWDTETGKQVFTGEAVAAGNETLNNANFSGDGKLLLTQDFTSSEVTTMKVWEVDQGRFLHSQAISYFYLVLSPFGRWLAAPSGDTNTDITLWDLSKLPDTNRASLNVSELQPMVSPDAHTALIANFAFSQDGTLMGTASMDSRAKVWRLSSEGIERLMTLSGHTKLVWDLAFSQDGTQLATGSSDGSARIWDITPSGASEWFTLAAHSENIYRFDLTDDGNYLATASPDGTAKVWDLVTGKELITITDHGGPLFSVAISPDGTRLATGGFDNLAKIWRLDLSSGTAAAELLRTLSGHTDGPPMSAIHGLSSVVFSPDGAKLATGGVDGLAKVWDVETGQELLSIQADPESGGVIRLAFSPDGLLLVTASAGSSSDDNDSIVNIWDLASGHVTSTFPKQGQDRGNIWSLAISPDGKRVATGGLNGILKIWDASTGGELLNLTGHTGTVSGLDFSPDGKYLASTSVDGTARAWDAASGEELLQYTSPSRPLYNMAFTPDGKHLIASGRGFVYGYVFDLDELIRLAYSRLTRWFTIDECRQFLHREDCPAR